MSHEYQGCFGNTGREDEATLRFLKRIDETELTTPSWCEPLLKYFKIDGPTGAGISGGRTSGMMHALTLAANPGVPRALRWLEFRPPETLGDPPRMARTADVTFETAHRGGQIFESVLRTLAEYRAFVKDEGPVAPHASMRLCTSYMKLKTIHRAVREQFNHEDYTYMVGLRADEPSRVASMARQSSNVCTFRMPLADAGITKAMVNAFWREQPFDLELEEPRGNCSLCFLKDEGDLAMLMLEDEEQTQEWIDLQDRYGDFRRGSTSMRTIFAEARVRLQVIRPAVAAFNHPTMPAGYVADPTWLAQARDMAEIAYQRRLNAWEEKKAGFVPEWDEVNGRLTTPENLPPKPKPGAALTRSDEDWARYRWNLLVKQEERYAREGRKAFSCACEAAQVDAAQDDSAA